MNNEYSEPSIEIIEVDKEDVVTASSDFPDNIDDPNK